MLLVDGMRCAACVWLIERALGMLAGVATVQVNATARRARIVFDPRRTSLPRLLETIARAGYRPLPLDRSALDDARRRESRDALKRLLVAGFGAMQAMMYASALYFGAFDTMDDATRGFFRWLGFLVATPVVLYSARPFFAGALRSLRARRMGMDVPVALAVAPIYAASLVVALRGGAEVYFESVSMFVFFLLCGRYVEMRARHRAGDLTDAIARLTPAFADRRRADGTLARVAVADLVAGARVHVADGDAVPADGRLESERCLVDESLLTGESTPVAKRRGDVHGGGQPGHRRSGRDRGDAVGSGHGAGGHRRAGDPRAGGPAEAGAGRRAGSRAFRRADPAADGDHRRALGCASIRRAPSMRPSRCWWCRARARSRWRCRRR